MKVSAVIPAKRDSVRLPRKNSLIFGDSTLLGHKIKKLQECSKIDEIIVGSNCDEILSHSESLGAIPVKRPEEVCDESICSANEMIGDLCGRIKTDIVVWTHCTNPLIEPQTYDDAVGIFLSHPSLLTFDSIISVDEVKEHLWKDGKPISYDPWAEKHTLAKDIKPMYKQNGAFFIQTHERFLQNSYFFGNYPYLYCTPPEESVDINTPLDFKLAEALL
jgi:CMP-N,N'-diacetyllegionaminic acid synthase